MYESVYCGIKTRDPHQKGHIDVKIILKFGVNRANIEQDTAIIKLENFLRDVLGLPDTPSGCLMCIFLSKILNFRMAVSRLI